MRVGLFWRSKMPISCVNPSRVASSRQSWPAFAVSSNLLSFILTTASRRSISAAQCTAHVLAYSLSLSLSLSILLSAMFIGLQCGSKNQTPSRFSNNLNKRWPVSIIFGRDNLRPQNYKHWPIFVEVIWNHRTGPEFFVPQCSLNLICMHHC